MVACKELKRMFEIEDDGEDSDSQHAKLPCRKYHKSVDLSRAPME
jgi:hypothetical protein